MLKWVSLNSEDDSLVFMTEGIVNLINLSVGRIIGPRKIPLAAFWHPQHG